jgi:Protein of unknown function (DUF3313)
MRNVGQLLRLTSMILGVCVTLAGCAAMGPPKPDEDSDDGLQLVPNSLIDELYVAPGVPLANYKRVMLDPIEVTFKKDWRKQHPDLKDRDFELLQKRMADMLRERLVAELARGGYLIAEAPDNDVLRLRASITDTDFAAPESADDKSTFVRSVGEMTLRVRAFDAPSGALVARARDYEQDPETQILQRADRVTTNIAALKIFDNWAESLRSALDVAKVSAGARKLQN